MVCPTTYLTLARLRRCGQLQGGGGVIILTCRNVKGFDIIVLQALSDTVDTEHLNYFHPASLSHLLTECSFEVLEVLTRGKLDAELVRKKILTGELDVSSRPFLKQVLVDEWKRVGDAFQQFLIANRRSSHMWLAAHKRG